MNNVLNIMKKEIMRFVQDRKIAFQVFILPGLMIYVIYSFMGYAMKSMVEKEKKEVYNVEIVRMPQNLENLEKDKSLNVKRIDSQSVKSDDKLEVIVNNAKEKIMTEKLDAVVIFPENFDKKVSEYSVLSSKDLPANVEIYYSSEYNNSDNAYGYINDRLNDYESAISNKFDINREGNKLASDKKDNDSKYNLSENKEDASVKKIFSSLLPLLVVMLVFSGANAAATESIVGEKERGTMATLLVTPVKRSSIALGKILSLSIIAVISGLSSFLGIILSLPKLMMADDNLSFTSTYGTKDYVLLIIIICSAACLFTSLVAIVSCFAKNVKDAQTALAPMTMVIAGISFAPALFDGMTDKLGLFAIPILNIIIVINKIFSGTYRNIEIIVTVISTVVCVALLSMFLGKLFNNEKIIFDK
ncbi:ABC transporter permease [Lachnobacterium bovis]|jgi:sodium transport system permease protein|uniref:Sodium transport system permease protein n=1 Tax=Lachnobacterium bovis DSM 14045 TaxID=1122142 RepID=A0A1H3KYA1_9FIRM|nr:ABC transporter permease [Lachnobacterium bovis]SDY56624.1 sodium transport system permease protein [Lachnobacterium bovis DSM 14045]